MPLISFLETVRSSSLRSRFSSSTLREYGKREFAALDTDNLIEELTELGKSEKRTLESNLMILLGLLVLYRQPPLSLLSKDQDRLNHLLGNEK